MTTFASLFTDNRILCSNLIGNGKPSEWARQLIFDLKEVAA